MRKGFLAALSVLLAGHGLAFAQQDGSYPGGHSWGPPGPVTRVSQPAAETVATPTPPPAMNSPPDNGNLDPVCREPPGDGDAQAQPFGLWGSGEYLLWWIKNGRVPPLVTAGGDGKPGSAGTQVLVDNLNFDDGVRQGGRFTLGYHLGTIPAVGVEASYFFLSDRQTDVRFSSGGDPLLAQPFLNVATGMPDANLVAKPGTAVGTVTVGAQTSLSGAEGNLTAGLICSDRFHLTALGGFRFLRLEDEVTAGEQFVVAPGVPGFGGSRVNLQDDFRTVNEFYGGQVGLETDVRFSRLTIDCRGKVALGGMHQGADVRGATVDLRPDGSTTLFPGGLFALRSNGGLHRRDELAFVPEVDLDVRWRLTPHWKVYAGYSLLWVSTVARAGEQIDPVVNVTQFPIRSGNGPLAGVARPAFTFDGTDFWAQGLHFGLELSY
jgi:hypothetical protein